MSKHMSKAFAILACIVSQIGFGSQGIVYKPMGDTINVFIFALLRDTGASICLLAVATAFEDFSPPPREDIMVFCALGFVGIFCQQVLFVLALEWCGPLVVAIYQPLIPVWTVFLAMVVGLEPLWPCSLALICKAVGILMAVVGAVVMILHGSSSQHTSFLRKDLYDLLPLGQTMLYSTYIVMQQKFIFAVPADNPRKLRWDGRPLSTTFWTYVSGAAFLWLVCIPYAVLAPSCLSFSPLAILPLCYAVFVVSTLSFALVTHANSKLSASLTTSFYPMQVPVATVLSRWLYDECITTSQLCGGALIVAGLLATTSSSLFDGIGASYKHVPCSDAKVETALATSMHRAEAL